MTLDKLKNFFNTKVLRSKTLSFIFIIFSISLTGNNVTKSEEPKVDMFLRTNLEEIESIRKKDSFTLLQIEQKIKQYALLPRKIDSTEGLGD